MELIPDTEKKIFLRKKGLSEDMIEEAFRRSEAQRNDKQT